MFVYEFRSPMRWCFRERTLTRTDLCHRPVSLLIASQLGHALVDGGRRRRSDRCGVRVGRVWVALNHRLVDHSPCLERIDCSGCRTMAVIYSVYRVSHHFACSLVTTVSPSGSSSLHFAHSLTSRSSKVVCKVKRRRCILRTLLVTESGERMCEKERPIQQDYSSNYHHYLLYFTVFVCLLHQKCYNNQPLLQWWRNLETLTLIMNSRSLQ